MGPEGLEVRVDDLAAQVIKGMAKSEVASMIAKKIVEEYGDSFIKEVVESITPEDVRKRVMWELTDRIIEKWRQDG